MKTEDGRLFVVCGSTRSGKTAWTKKAAGRQPLVHCWDVEGQWRELRGWTAVHGRPSLSAAVQNGARGRFAFQPAADLRSDFDHWARWQLWRAKTAGGGAVIAEELADVTHAGKASGYWGLLVRRALKRGTSIYAITQRPAEVDKTTIGNMTDMVCFRLSRLKDRQAVAAEIGVEVSDLTALQPLDFIRADMTTGTITRGRLKF